VSAALTTWEWRRLEVAWSSPDNAHLLVHSLQDTDTWEWSRLSGDSPEQPAPCPRDRASMMAVGPSRLLLVGGADSLNRRLDDCWVFDLDM